MYDYDYEILSRGRQLCHSAMTVLEVWVCAKMATEILVVFSVRDDRAVNHNHIPTFA